MAGTTLPSSTHSLSPCSVLVLWRKSRSYAIEDYYIFSILLFQKESDLICEQSRVEILPYLVHSRFQWFPEDSNRCIHGSVKHKLPLCYSCVEGHVQGHRWKWSLCRILLSTQGDNHSCRLRKKVTWLEHLNRDGYKLADVKLAVLTKVPR